MSIELAPQDILEIIRQLGEIPVISANKAEPLQKVVDLAHLALGSRLCTVVQVDLEGGYWIAVACAGCDQALLQRMANRRFKINLPLIAGADVIEMHNLQSNGQGIIDPRIAAQYGIHSALCFPMKLGGRLVGYLNHFAAEPLGETQRTLAEIFAQHAVIAVSSFENQTSREQLEKLTTIMSRIAEARNVDDLFRQLLEDGMKLVGATTGWISRINLDTGELHIVEYKGPPHPPKVLSWGEGITGKALKDERPVLAGDVHDQKWRGIYKEILPNTISEMAIPIIVANAEAHVGCDISLATKPLGVFNVESPQPGVFTRADQEILLSLMRQAAVMIERLETDHKLAELARVQQEMAAKRDWDDVMLSLMDAITGILGYHFVNISIVDRERRVIRTEYVKGNPKGKDEDFKRWTSHSLDSTDIQADIVRNGKIEVPGIDDERFDRSLFRQFGHDQLIRVYVPMIASADSSIFGTVEAGYRRQYRKHIYERDVQILKGFVDYAVQALEQRKKGLLDKISHELRAPTIGIRSNASFLQRRRSELSEETIERKLDDILADCENLLYQARELEHILGRKQPEPKIARTLLFRDVIIKTLNQLKPLVVEHGFTLEQIQYDSSDMHKIEPLYIDRTQINQVVYNLLINAIKYAEHEFRVQIAVELTRDAYAVKFRDWGMGVRSEMTDRIFDDGFRTPEATLRYPNGSGLGLTIARKIMRSYEGDLRLANPRQPTEFHMILPKRLKEKPHDSVRG